MDTKVLIIGAGHAGIETAASLRNLGFSGKIEIFDQFPNTKHLEIVSLLSVN